MSANYNLLKQLPPNIKIYVEPMSTDAGNAIGAAKYVYYSLTQSKEIKKQTRISACMFVVIYFFNPHCHRGFSPFL